jgi:F-type H+-transporting ATPase subunit epsilon
VARTPYPVEVLTPEGQVFAGEVEMLSTRTEVGEIGVLANHTPLLAMLQPADLRLHISESEVKHYAQGEGYLQVHDNHALVLVEECSDPDRIDRAEQEERLRKAEEVLAECKTPAELASARAQQALRDKRRAETFLRISGGEPAQGLP